jgi:hypothetical protein
MVTAPPVSMAALSFSPFHNHKLTKPMANYYATARSNYFAVKDEKAFRESTALLGLTILEPTHHDKVADGDSQIWNRSRRF